MAHDVVAVDVVPAAVACAQANAVRNHVADRVTFVVGDLFDAVGGTFDLIVFDPPFRWFRPRDELEVAMADEGYRTLRRFVREARDRLRPGGRILLFFGTSGDIAYLRRLVDEAGFDVEVVAESHATREGHTATYSVLRLT